MPAKAATSASRNPSRGFSPHQPHANSVTRIGAQFASSVEAAIEVSSSEECHSARSPAKNTPAQKNCGSRRLAGARPAARAARRSSSAHSASGGSARQPRQKAVAVGPVSDRRTKMPELPIASAPASSASRAVSSERRA